MAMSTKRKSQIASVNDDLKCGWKNSKGESFTVDDYMKAVEDIKNRRPVQIQNFGYDKCAYEKLR